MNKAPRIAIVDDDKSCRMALGSLVRSLGYKPCLFSRAQDLLASPEIDDMDCLISDVQMPGMDGLELQRNLVEAGRSIPILFITAYPKESVRQRALAAGAEGVLAKPYNAQVVIDFIERIVKP
ncbi:response regulator transcription factor [Pseudomonas sp. LS-2]|uniref:response regulator transcription factor n=1 Tax=Pseudomonas sp. LS-2 TaxID=2315859 RepID=UPI000E73AD6D|nr:response regulator [Pseudomonas sp. LS-2]RJX79292.1 response regulator [Pseudomonas sp. LS-2]